MSAIHVMHIRLNIVSTGGSLLYWFFLCVRGCGLWTGLCADHVMLMWLVVTLSPDFNLSLCL